MNGRRTKLDKPLLWAWALTLALGVGTVHGQCEANELVKVSPCTQGYCDTFSYGVSIATDSDVAVVGRCYATPIGAAHVYRLHLGTWVEEVQLVPPDGASLDCFGGSVSVHGDLVVVGSSSHDSAAPNGGAVYVYRFDGAAWSEAAKLTASDAASGDYFGGAVAAQDGVIVVGARGRDGVAENSGAAYVYRFDGTAWFEEAQLTASDAAANRFFGSAVSLDDTTLVVGTPASNDPGAAYVFRYDGHDWVEEAKLIAGDAADQDRFGGSVGVSGDAIIIGATNWVVHTNSAYLFRRIGANWSQEAKLTPPDGDGGGGDYFGNAVAVDGDWALIGAMWDDCPAGSSCGAAYLYQFDGSAWTWRAKLLPVERLKYGQFGGSVALGGGWAAIGAPASSQAHYYDGAAYFFAGMGDCNNNAEADICDFAVGAGADCNTNLLLDECDILSGASVDCDADVVPDDCEPDCNHNGVADDCDIAGPLSNDCNTNAVPDDCETDCNGNGVGDPCDIRDGTSDDCNSNTLPDECEPQEDCNTNGVQDICDIAAGTAADANGNGLPDECETGEPCTAVELARLTAPGVAPHDMFGFSVAVDGDAMVVGADSYYDAASGAPAVLVYRRTGSRWALESTLVASTGAEARGFGWAVGIEDNVALIGAPSEESGEAYSAGAAYVFRFDGSHWVEEARLTAPQPAESDLFGSAVSIDDGLAVVGAPLASDRQAYCGLVFAYRFDGSQWVQEAQLKASDAAAGGGFGVSVAVDGDALLVGALSSENPPYGWIFTGPGAAYLYQRIGGVWIEHAKFLSTTPTVSDRFGGSVALSGGVAAVGASNDAASGEGQYDGAGAVYIYRPIGNVWADRTKLRASDAAPGRRFGFVPTLSGDRLVVGSLAEAYGSTVPSLYVEHWDGAHWREEAVLVPSQAAQDHPWAFPAFSGDVAVMGAYGDNQAGERAGAVYVFHGLSADCNANGASDLCDIAGGARDKNRDGVPDTCQLETDASRRPLP